jgi:hypothetical protein
VTQEKKSNTAKGRHSQDANVGGDLVAFVNRASSPYPTEVGGARFEPIPVERQKDIMVNVARMHAQQEYDRIMSLVAVLQAQADQVRRRLEITDWVHAAHYEFQVYHGQCYWLVFDTRKQLTRLVRIGPGDWHTAPPEEYQYLARVRWLGDHTWVEVDDAGNPVNRTG